MTCQEYADLNQRAGGDITKLTRAERFAVARHYLTCPDCHEATDQASEERPLTPEEDARTAQLADEDRQAGDPEAVLGEIGDWCHTCGMPIGIGTCPGCLAVGSLEPDEAEPICGHCGKALEDFSDLGCEHCDQRHPGYGTTA